MRRSVSSDVGSGSPLVISDAVKEMVKSFREAIKYCSGRKAFSTQSGRLGIGPQALQNGDVIAVSKLSLWPMVLHRAEDSGPDHYTVIGAAVIEGITSGDKVFAAAAERGRIGTIHLV